MVKILNQTRSNTVKEKRHGAIVACISTRAINLKMSNATAVQILLLPNVNY